MWLLLGLYGSQDLEMGMYYSRVMKANSLFVKEIKVSWVIWFVHFEFRACLCLMSPLRPVCVRVLVLVCTSLGRFDF